MIGPVDPVGGTAARRAAQAELRRREYRPAQRGVLERVAHWLSRQLGRLFSGGADSSALLVVLVLLLAAGIFFATRAGVPTRRARSAGGDDLLAPDSEVDHRARALRFMADGRRAEAVREWLRDAVRTIERRGVLPPQPGRTGSATARAAGPLLPAAAEPLGAATAAFDEVWFGGRPASDVDVTHARTAADAVATARIVAGATEQGLVAPW